MNILDEYLNKIQDDLDIDDDVYDHPVEFPRPSYPEDESPECQQGMRWCHRRQKCVPIDGMGGHDVKPNSEYNKKI